MSSSLAAGALDWFVFEGLFHNYMEKYGYESFKYRDGLAGRIRLFFAMLLPSKIERDVFSSYVSPSYFKDFLRGLRDEAQGAVPLKDYTFNAYYRHKWTQKDLRLHRPRWFVELLRNALRQAAESPGALSKLRLGFARRVYFGVNLLRYAWAVVVYPKMVIKRWGVTGAAFVRMTRGRNALPETLPPL